MTRGEIRESLNLRVVPELKRRVERVAAHTGVPVNTAASLLLMAGLNAEEIAGWMKSHDSEEAS